MRAPQSTKPDRARPDVSRLGSLHVLVDSVDQADAAIAGGAGVIQVRLKAGTDAERFAAAAAIAMRCRRAQVTCLVNDRVDLALAVDADGVHLGAADLPVEAVRRIAGPRPIVGGTARDADSARRLVAAGADYLGVGPVYSTSSKSGLPVPLGPPGIAAVAAAVNVPVIAIAGITSERVAEVVAAGADGVAVIGAVVHAPSPANAARTLVHALEQTSGAR